jgi:Tfp pilus assembly protein PilN
MVERIEINLLPAEYRVHKRGIRLSRSTVYPGLGLCVLGFFLLSWTIGLDSQIRQLKNDILSVDDMIRKNLYIKEQINKLRADRAVIQEKIVALERINVNREKWVRLMEILCQRVPDFTWLISVEEKDQNPPVLSIEGRTMSFPEVANFMSRLSESEFIRSVDLSGIEETKEETKMFRFNITCTINPNARLETETKSEAAQDSTRSRRGN